MIYCSNCNTQNRDGSKFCNNCGTHFAAPTSPVNAGQPPVPPADETRAPSSSPTKPTLVSTPPAAAQSENKQDMMDLPEWLRRLRAAVEDDHEVETAETAEPPIAPSDPPSAKTSTEEWLSLLRDNPPQVEDKPTAPPAQSDAAPDWIKKLSELEPEGEGPVLNELVDEERHAETPAPPFEFTARTLPEPTDQQGASFFGEIDSGATVQTEETPVEPVSGQKSEADQEELPSWLKDISQAEQEAQVPAEPEPEPQPTSTDEGEQPILFGEEWTPEAVPATDEEMPAWVRRLRPPSLDEPGAAKEPSVLDQERISEDQGASSGEQLFEEQRAPVQELLPPQVAVTSPTKPASLPEDVRDGESDQDAILPDWLSLATMTEEPPATPPAPSDNPTIEPAHPDEVPSWVAALKPPSVTRPSEPVQGAGADSNALVEGLAGVLPLAIAITEPHVSGERPGKVEAPKGGHLFESILADTSPATEAVAPSKAQRKLSVRPLIYAALLLAVLVPFLLPADMAGYAVALSDTSSYFYNTLHSVPANGTVVIAFDYEPSLAGEMDLQANAIVRDLAERNVKVIAVSTLPTGPQVAQHVLDNAIARNANYAYGTGYVNYGYIPGQDAGLLQLATNGFASDARDYALGQSLDKYPLTANFKKLGDARLLIELAGTEEPLKMWMEQVQPRIPIQMIAGVSAAVEPRAQVYLNAKQLSAYSAGLMDAARLEILGSREGLAVASANALTWAMIVLVVVILIGNVVYWVSRLRGKAA